MDQLQAMRVYVQIARLGSLAAAGRELGLSPSSVARQLSDLERSLGVRLCNRTTRRLSLTPEGEEYLELSRRCLQDLDDIHSRFSTGRAQVHGRIAVAAPVLLGQLLIAPLSRRFVQLHPGVSCQLSMADRVVDLVEEGFDVAVRIANLSDSSFVAYPVGQVQRVIVASPKYLAGLPKPPSEPDDLLGLNCLCSWHPWPLWVKGRETYLQVKGNLDFNLARPTIDACVEGEGVGIFFNYQVAQEIKAGQLQTLLGAFMRPATSVNLVVPQAKVLPERTRSYVRWMQKHLREDLSGLLSSD